MRSIDRHVGRQVGHVEETVSAIDQLVEDPAEQSRLLGEKRS